MDPTGLNRLHVLQRGVVEQSRRVAVTLDDDDVGVPAIAFSGVMSPLRSFSGTAKVAPTVSTHTRPQSPVLTLVMSAELR